LPSTPLIQQALTPPQPFRSSNRQAVNTEDSIIINLSDFATDEISCGHESVTLGILFSQLADFLNKAEEIQEAREPRTGGRSIKSRRQTRKRKLSSSSAEELRSEDEAKILDDERRIAGRAAANDQEFTIPGTKRRL
jgi:hypothetical protein